ncbi:MAG: FAD-dependent oxidoreductase, partial [Dongiaceae bacterium]
MITAFDYIVVGAGSAGCVLAARLTEERGVSVAVLEAGDRDTATEILTPVTFAQLFKTSYDWDYASEPEPALNGRRVYLPRGKGLGGSSSINAMMYLRGNRLDYDDWAKDGARGWSYDEMLPYFIKAECNERGAGPYHGSLGPLSVQEGRSNHPLTDRFLEAAKQAGHPWNDDFNGARQDGIGRFQVTQRNGLRCSAAMAYLHPAADRPNLQIFTAAQTNRILFEGRRAVGVEIVRHGQAETLRAKREVILAAGAYNSPQLLMLSGIGIAAELKALGIQAWHELPVGEELQDHPGVPLCYLTDQPSLLSAGTEADIALFQNEGRGPLSSNICEGGGFYRTDPNFPAPDVELMSGPVMFYDEGLGPVTDHAYGLGPCILKPTSRGKVSLRSAR